MSPLFQNKKIKLEKTEESPTEYFISKYPNQVRLTIKINSITNDSHSYIECTRDFLLFYKTKIILKNQCSQREWTPLKFMWSYDFFNSLKKTSIKELEIVGGCEWYYYEIGNCLPSTIKKITFKDCIMSRYDILMILNSISKTNLKLNDIIFNIKPSGFIQDKRFTKYVLRYIERTPSLLNLYLPYKICNIDKILNLNRDIYKKLMEKAMLIKLGSELDSNCNFNLFNLPKVIIDTICKYVLN